MQILHLTITFLNTWIVDIQVVSQDFNFHSNNLFKGVINKKGTL
jgi:hypothetical protein